MTSMKTTRPGRGTADTETFTVTTHHIHVDLAEQLRGIDPGDLVTILITTPSGREKRVALNGGFLVAPRMDAEGW